MPDFFSVQMNRPDIPNVQVEQSGSTSVGNPTKTTENSFNSILQQALPKDTKETPSEVNSLSQENDFELTELSGAGAKTTTSIDQSLFMSGENDLEANGTNEKTATSIDQSLLPSGDNDLKANVLQLFAYITNKINKVPNIVMTRNLWDPISRTISSLTIFLKKYLIE